MKASCIVDMRAQTIICSQDALRFPLIGSAVLLGLFIVFKLFNKDLVNALLTAYFVVRFGLGNNITEIYMLFTICVINRT